MKPIFLIVNVPLAFAPNSELSQLMLTNAQVVLFVQKNALLVPSSGRAKHHILLLTTNVSHVETVMKYASLMQS